MPQPMRHAIVAICATIAVFAIAPSFAIANEAKEAQAAYENGMEAYFAGKYSDAIISFTRAYQLEPNPIFLFNMSIAYEKAGNLEEAFKEGLRAQEEGLPDEAAQINDARVPALSIAINGREVAGRISGSLPCGSNADCRDGLSCSSATNMCVEPDAVGDAAPGEGPFLGIPFSLYGWIGSSLGVVGLGLTAAAIIIDLGLGNDIDNYNALSETEKRSNAGNTIADDIEGRQQLGQVFLYSGGVLVATGAGLVIYDLFFNDGNEHRAASLDVGVGPDGATVRASWHF